MSPYLILHNFISYVLFNCTCIETENLTYGIQDWEVENVVLAFSSKHFQITTKL